MGDVGLPELLLILFVILPLFGPQKIPRIAQFLGESIKEFKKALIEAPPPEEKKNSSPLQPSYCQCGEARVDLPSKHGFDS